MFDDYTVRSTESQPRGYVREVNEHRAATDESIRILDEMWDKTIRRV